MLILIGHTFLQSRHGFRHASPVFVGSKLLTTHLVSGSSASRGAQQCDREYQRGVGTQYDFESSKYAILDVTPHK